MADEDKKYCVTITAPEVQIMVILPMDDAHLALAKEHNVISWVFNNGCQIVIDKNFLDSFTVELVQ